MTEPISIKFNEIRGLVNEIKSKYFVVMLSNEENLNICRDCSIAGFPETDNGQWAFLDINEGDFVSFYYNGRLYDLYKVVSKYIVKGWRSSLARGSEDKDPVELCNNQKWLSIKSRSEYIYFPFRLKLGRLCESDFDTSLVFKGGLERLGINLIPRGSLKKTHFQLSISDIEKIFQLEPDHKFINVSMTDFLLCANRSRARKNSSNNMNFDSTTVNIDDITHQEKYLQVLYKRILERYWGALKTHLTSNFDDLNLFEFFSEQTVYGGEADIVINYRNDDFLFIEVKNDQVASRKGLTNRGKEAYSKVKEYKPLVKPEKKILRAIAGKKPLQDGVLMSIMKENSVFVFELNSKFDISNFDNIG